MQFDIWFVMAFFNHSPVKNFCNVSLFSSPTKKNPKNLYLQKDYFIIPQQINEIKCSYAIIQTEITAISIIKNVCENLDFLFQGAFFVCSVDKPRVPSKFNLIN